MSHKKAFTLIELLLTSILFVGIAMLATGAFTQILQTPVAAQRHQQAQQQVAGLLDEIESDLHNAAAIPAAPAGSPDYKGKTWVITMAPQEQLNKNVPEKWPDNDALVVPVFRNNGTEGEWHVYCMAEGVSGQGVYLAKRYIVPLKDGTILTKPLGSNPASSCNTLDNVSSFFITDSISQNLWENSGNGAGVISDPQSIKISNLDFSNLAVRSLKFTPIWFNPDQAIPLADLDPQKTIAPDAVRVDVVASYYAGSDVEVRQNDQLSEISRPIVMRRLISLKQNYAVHAQ